MIRTYVIVASIGVAAIAAAACLDFTPNYVAPADAAPPPDAGPVDAGPDAPDVDIRPTCQKCIETPDKPGPGCADELATCLADDKCKSAYECILANGCLTKGTRQKVLICGLPCADQAGIVSQTEPAALEILAVAACAGMACQPYCLADGGGD